jgi:hypothetical protein
MSQMRDSAKSAEWVERVVRENPIQQIMNAQTGQWDGNIRTCPVRLSFFNNGLHQAVGGQNDDGTDKKPSFEVQILFPPCAGPQIDSILRPVVANAERRDFPRNMGQDGVMFGLHSPFRMQDEKQNYGGFTPGGVFIRATTLYKPQVVDVNNNPIVDTDGRAYPGVWALVSINLFSYGVSPPRPKKGISFGLQAVMIVADDNKLGGGAVDTKTQFQGVKIDGAFDPAKAFGQATPAAPPLSAAHSALI